MSSQSETQKVRIYLLTVSKADSRTHKNDNVVEFYSINDKLFQKSLESDMDGGWSIKSVTPLGSIDARQCLGQVNAGVLQTVLVLFERRPEGVY